MEMSMAEAFFTSTCGECVVLPNEVLGSPSHRCVNTSLSGTLFF